AVPGDEPADPGRHARRDRGRHRAEPRAPAGGLRRPAPRGRSMTGLLAGQVAVVTGAARGQGRSHALALAREGASIIALDACAPIATVPYPLSPKADLETTAEQVEALGNRVVHGVVDVRDLAEMDQFIRDAVADLGRLDIVCANAGISTPSPTLDMTEETWQTTIDINLTGVWKTCKAAVPHIVAGKPGGSWIT